MSDQSSTYWVLVTVKNGETTIKQSIESILFQSIKPSFICVVDDGSTDSTKVILSELMKNNKNFIHIITLPDKGYDSRRIVHNWNKACEYVKECGYSYSYLLISSDDVVFPEDYVQKLINEIEQDPKLVIVSGNRGLQQSDYMSLPEGAGRLIRMKFFKQIGFRHPPYYGYEPWILYKALQLGYKVKKLTEIKYEHLRTFGVGHKFVEYGPAMRCLGYHPMFVLARVLRNFFTGKAGISKLASVHMFFDYILERKWKNDPYFHYFEPELRLFVRSMQKKRLLSKITE
ncbi:MAG TPA: glycosyltransferase family A protein [Nitrosopumilaceae archaeon]|nr:glycosyltransferase family A protein [Nitrosopumilaceae archaeon]